MHQFYINYRRTMIFLFVLLSKVRGQVNKFLEKYSKTHFFYRFIFISQHSLLSARYTWSNASSTFLSRPNNMICPTLQNKPLFRRWVALWWWISFFRTISSDLETGNSSKGLNLANMMDGEAIFFKMLLKRPNKAA